jgi:D-alanyl-D-alanine carboxypeptidase
MLLIPSTSERFALLTALVLGAGTLPALQTVRVDTPRAAQGALDELVTSIGNRAIDEDGVPGLAIAVATDGEIAVCRGFGYADAARAEPATANTLWPIGSFAHPFTAVAVLQLVEAGKLALDDDLAKLLPEFPVKQHDVKLRHLLANTSGVPGWAQLHAKHPEVAKQEMNAKEFLALYADVPFEFEPGSGYSFYTTGYVLLDMILARASGEPATQYLLKHIIAPVGMTHTAVCPVDARPSGYAADCKHVLDEHDFDLPMPATRQAGSAALCSTAGDLAVWMDAVYDKNAFGADTTAAMTTAVKLSSGKPTGASFAMSLATLGDSACYVHSGGGGGFRLQVAHYARTHTTVIVLANCDSAKVDEYEHEIACRVLGLPSPNPRDLVLDPKEAQLYAGNYQVVTTRVRIIANAGNLTLEWPIGAPIELRYRGASTFVFADERDTKLVFRFEEGKVVGFELTRAGLVSAGRRMD